MKVKLEILRPGDSVLSVWDSHVAVRKASGEVEIFQYYLDEENLPRLSEKTLLITHGNGTISAKIDENNEDSVEIVTF